jgi:hypothetical protein
MKKRTFLWGPLLAAPLAVWGLVLAGCGAVSGGGDGTGVSGGDSPAELVGSWYNTGHELVFEITQAGEGYIAGTKTHCTVTVSGRYVYFRQDTDTKGSFRYSINSGGALVMTSGLSAFSGAQSGSPFIRSGAIPAGATVPVELIGKWYNAANPPPSTLRFEITPAGTVSIPGAEEAAYSVMVSGNTVSVLNGSVLKGGFRYSIRYGEMFVTSGTGVCEGLSLLSPFIKRNS